MGCGGSTAAGAPPPEARPEPPADDSYVIASPPPSAAASPESVVEAAEDGAEELDPSISDPEASRRKFRSRSVVKSDEGVVDTAALRDRAVERQMQLEAAGLAAEQAAAKAGVERKPKEEAPAPAEAAPPVEATPPAEATPPPPKPQHLTVKIEIGDGTGEPTKVLLSVAA
jgi:hypothetical protein